MIPLERRDAAVSCWLTPADLGKTPHGKVEVTSHPLWPITERKPIAHEVVYISGPVPEKGRIRSGIVEFSWAQVMLLSAGCTVFNPIHIEWPIDPLNGDALERYFMHFCVRALPECDAIFLLPGWQNSQAAKWEKKIADILGLNVYYAPVLEKE
jgi:Domain of unknown function (DUF4406)